jgi:hypothetical protein
MQERGMAPRASAAQAAGLCGAIPTDGDGTRDFHERDLLNQAADRKMALGQIAGELTAAIRRALIEPAEVTIATIGRIAAQEYSPEIAAHAIEQLRELARALNYKLKNDGLAIQKLRDGLAGFERRLSGMP